MTALADGQHPSPKLVHVIEDDDDVRDSLTMLFRGRGFPVRAYSSARDFLGDESVETDGCIVTDYQMPQMNGLQLVARLREVGRDTPVIVITGRASPALEAQARALGVAGFIEKPFEPEQIVAVVQKALDQMRRR